MQIKIMLIALSRTNFVACRRKNNYLLLALLAFYHVDLSPL